MTRALCRLLPVGGLLLGLALPAVAQEPQSAGPARELAELLQAKKLDTIAARVPNAESTFAAALLFPGQMIVVWADFSVPAVLNEKLLKRQYREVYIDLNSASDPETRHFVTDFGADGLRHAERNQPADSHDIGAKSVRFDSNWREDKMSEKDYMGAYAAADSAYARMLNVLLAEMKRGG